MSEEEIINVFKTVFIANKFSGIYSSNDIIIEAMKGLLDLYNKEKEKNKEYIENTELLKKYIRENYISKDKIKEKIKYYIECRDCKFDYMSHMYLKYDAIVKVLQELLEEVE